MLVVDDAEYDHAVDRLRSAGFQDCNWSFGTLKPDFYQRDPIKERIYQCLVRDYSKLDQNSAHFFFPPEQQMEQQDTKSKIVLRRSSYAHMRTSDENLTPGDNIQYPDASMLLLSSVRTLMREPSLVGWLALEKDWRGPHVTWRWQLLRQSRHAPSCPRCPVHLHYDHARFNPSTPICTELTDFPDGY